jgi:guanine deaminase
MATAPTTAIRGPVLTFKDDPFKVGLERAMVHETDAIVAFGSGVVTHFGPANEVAATLPGGLQVQNYGPDAVISAGFLDSHVHFSQTPMIAAFGEQLLDWLNKYTFPTEGKFVDKAFASSVAKCLSEIILSHVNRL